MGETIAEALVPDTIKDAKGRVLTLRTINVLQQVRLLRAIGPDQARNQPYVEIVMMAASVDNIDGVPIPMPTNERLIDLAIDRIGDDGFAALMVDMNRKFADLTAAAEVAGAPSDPLAPSA